MNSRDPLGILSWTSGKCSKNSCTKCEVVAKTTFQSIVFQIGVCGINRRRGSSPLPLPSAPPPLLPSLYTLSLPWLCRFVSCLFSSGTCKCIVTCIAQQYQTSHKCLYVCVRVCVRACVRVCVYAGVYVCVCVCVKVDLVNCPLFLFCCVCAGLISEPIFCPYMALKDCIPQSW